MPTMADSNNDPTKVLAVKRYLTNSEKNREFLKRGMAPEETFFGVRVVECPKNLVVERKLSKEVELLEKQQRVMLSRINSSQHIMKLNFRKFRKGCPSLGGDKGEDVDDVQPGFAFHHDGTRKSSIDMNIHNSIHQLKKDIDTIHHFTDYRPSVHALKAKLSIISNTTDEDTRNEYDRDMKAIEKSVKELSEEARNVKCKMIEDSKVKKHPYLRAHQNEYVWHLPSGSIRLMKGPQQPDLVMEDTGSGFRQNDSGYLLLDRRGKLHKASYHIKPQCDACKFRVKNKDDRKIDTTDSPALSDGLHNHKFVVGSMNSQSTIFRVPSCYLKDREHLEHSQMGSSTHVGHSNASPSRDKETHASKRGSSACAPKIECNGISPLARTLSPKTLDKTPSPPKTPKPDRPKTRRASEVLAISEVRPLLESDDSDSDLTFRRHSYSDAVTAAPSSNLRLQLFKQATSKHGSDSMEQITKSAEGSTDDHRRSKTSVPGRLASDEEEMTGKRRCISARARLLQRAALESKSSCVKIDAFLKKFETTDDKKPPVRPAGTDPNAVHRRRNTTPFCTDVKTPKQELFYSPTNIETEKDLSILMKDMKKCRYLREYKPRKIYWH